MKSIFDNIFSLAPDAPLPEQQREQALRELVKVVSYVTRLKASPQHQRITKRIEELMRQAEQPF